MLLRAAVRTVPEGTVKDQHVRAGFLYFRRNSYPAINFFWPISALEPNNHYEVLTTPRNSGGVRCLLGLC